MACDFDMSRKLTIPSLLGEQLSIYSWSRQTTYLRRLPKPFCGLAADTMSMSTPARMAWRANLLVKPHRFAFWGCWLRSENFFFFFYWKKVHKWSKYRHKTKPSYSIWSLWTWVGRARVVILICLFLPNGEWADPGGTAIPGQPVARVEQAPYTSPMSKNQFNIEVAQWATYQILSW